MSTIVSTVPNRNGSINGFRTSIIRRSVTAINNYHNKTSTLDSGLKMMNNSENLFETREPIKSISLDANNNPHHHYRHQQHLHRGKSSFSHNGTTKNRADMFELKSISMTTLN